MSSHATQYRPMRNLFLRLSLSVGGVWINDVDDGCVVGQEPELITLNYIHTQICCNSCSNNSLYYICQFRRLSVLNLILHVRYKMTLTFDSQCIYSNCNCIHIHNCNHKRYIFWGIWFIQVCTSWNDLSRSLKVNNNGSVWLIIYDFLLCVL